MVAKVFLQLVLKSSPAYGQINHQREELEEMTNTNLKHNDKCNDSTPPPA